MKEELQRYALIAEIIGGIAIVASLVFVGVQIQQNTNLTRANAYRDSISELADWREMVKTDSRHISCYLSYIDLENETYDTAQCDMMGIVVANVFGIYETAYFDNSYGFIGDSEWSRLEVAACFHFRVANARNTIPGFTNEEFLNYLEENCR